MAPQPGRPKWARTLDEDQDPWKGKPFYHENAPRKGCNTAHQQQQQRGDESSPSPLWMVGVASSLKTKVKRRWCLEEGRRKVASVTRFDKVLRSSRYENPPPALFIQKQDQLDFIVMSGFLERSRGLLLLGMAKGNYEASYGFI